MVDMLLRIISDQPFKPGIALRKALVGFYSGGQLVSVLMADLSIRSSVPPIGRVDRPQC
jgi:hypothetical protein